MRFTVGQSQHKGSDVTVETRASCLLLGRNDLKVLLALDVKDLWIFFELLGKFS
jgi:hypothetical protein